jgi:hypothetical protein
MRHEFRSTPPLRRARGAIALPAVAAGALALGALAIGALAIGSLVIGRMAVNRLRLRHVVIDDLTVRRLRVLDKEPRGHPTDIALKQDRAMTIPREA